jgi:hypothetical protein
VLAVPATPQPWCSQLARAFPKIRHSICQISLITCASWTYTYFLKLVCLWVPWWRRYWCLNNCFPAVQKSAMPLTLYSRSPANQWSKHQDLLPQHTPYNPTNWIAFWFCDNHATAHHNHRCPPTCMSWMHRCFTAFPAKPLYESPSPLTWWCVY